MRNEEDVARGRNERKVAISHRARISLLNEKRQRKKNRRKLLFSHRTFFFVIPDLAVD